MTLNFEEYKTKLYSAVLADTLDSLGYHKQTLTPGIKSIKPDVIICGLARVGLYMPIYHDDENTNVYEHEITLIDSLKENEIAVLCCHGNEKIAPWGELLSTRATYLKSAGCLTDGCVRDTKMINEIGEPENVDKYIQIKRGKKEPITGFGHRVYKKRRSQSRPP